MVDENQTVEPCPTKCSFNWAKFHMDLDIAMSHMIEESKVSPTQTTLMEFAEYSHKKVLAHKERDTSIENLKRKLKND